MNETQKQAEEQMAKQAEQPKEEIPDIVLDCRIKAGGGMEWKIPADLEMAIFLHKHLEIMINERYLFNFRKANAPRPKDDIRKKIMKIF